MKDRELANKQAKYIVFWILLWKKAIKQNVYFVWTFIQMYQLWRDILKQLGNKTMVGQYDLINFLRFDDVIMFVLKKKKGGYLSIKHADWSIYG